MTGRPRLQPPQLPPQLPARASPTQLQTAGGAQRAESLLFQEQYVILPALAGAPQAAGSISTSERGSSDIGPRPGSDG
jgi:hypothetical protein